MRAGRREQSEAMGVGSDGAPLGHPLSDATATPLTGGRRIAWGTILAMVVLVPLVMSDFILPGSRTGLAFDSVAIVKLSVELILGLVALGAWGWDLLCHGGRIRHTPLDWLILAWLVWVAITTITSVYWPMSLFGAPDRYEGLLTLVVYALFYFLVLQFADTPERVCRLAQALFSTSLIVSIYGLLQYAGVVFVPEGVLEGRVFSTYAHPTYLGGFLVFAASISLGLALHEQRPVWRLVYWVGFALNELALIGTATRSAWAGGVVSLIALGIMVWRQRVAVRRLDWSSLGACVALSAGLLWHVYRRNLFEGRATSLVDFSTGSGRSRTLIWQAIIDAIKERPILGWGADTSHIAFARFAPLGWMRSGNDFVGAEDAHNLPLQLASTVGIPGALLFFGIFGWGAIRSFHTVFGRAADSTGIILGAFWAGAVGYFVHLLLAYSTVGVTIFLWMALAVVLVPTARTRVVRAQKRGTLAAVGLLVIAAMGIGYQGVVLEADRSFVAAEVEDGLLSDRTYDERAADALRAVKLNPHNAKYRSGLGAIHLEELRQVAAAVVTARESGMDTAQYAESLRSSFTNAESAFKEAIASAPDLYVNYVSLASVYVLGGSALDEQLYQRVFAVAERGLQAKPLGIEIRMQLAQALLGLGRTDDAIETLERCMEIAPGKVSAALLLADAYQEQGRPADALALLKSVEALRPGQAEITAAIRRLEAEQSEP